MFPINLSLPPPPAAPSKMEDSPRSLVLTGVLSPVQSFLESLPLSSTFQAPCRKADLKDTVPPKLNINAHIELRLSPASATESNHVVLQAVLSWWAPTMMTVPRKQHVARFRGEKPWVASSSNNLFDLFGHGQERLGNGSRTVFPVEFSHNMFLCQTLDTSSKLEGKVQLP